MPLLPLKDMDDLRDWASGTECPGLDVRSLVQRLCALIDGESLNDNARLLEEPALSEPLETAIRVFALRMRFTPRETAVFRELFLGDVSVQALAMRLKIKPNTVNNHLKGLFERTRTHNRSDLLACFIRETI
jgi:DNA-binding CsgD family transcriptional regulator